MMLATISEAQVKVIAGARARGAAEDLPKGQSTVEIDDERGIVIYSENLAKLPEARQRIEHVTAAFRAQGIERLADAVRDADGRRRGIAVVFKGDGDDRQSVERAMANVL